MAFIHQTFYARCGHTVFNANVTNISESGFLMVNDRCDLTCYQVINPATRVSMIEKINLHVMACLTAADKEPLLTAEIPVGMAQMARSQAESIAADWGSRMMDGQHSIGVPVPALGISQRQQLAPTPFHPMNRASNQGGCEFRRAHRRARPRLRADTTSRIRRCSTAMPCEAAPGPALDSAVPTLYSSYVSLSNTTNRRLRGLAYSRFAPPHNFESQHINYNTPMPPVPLAPGFDTMRCEPPLDYDMGFGPSAPPMIMVQQPASMYPLADPSAAPGAAEPELPIQPENTPMSPVEPRSMEPMTATAGDIALK